LELKQEDKNSIEPLDEVIQKEEEILKLNIEIAISEAIASLNSRSRSALQSRFSLRSKQCSVSSLASQWGVSRQRIYQIANEAIKTIHKIIRNNYDGN
jgi:DNA-directed RNA polymerase sigma subunit (sigma70/sigma32)